MLLSGTFAKSSLIRSSILIAAIILSACQAGLNQPSKGASGSGGSADTRPNAPVVQTVVGLNPNHGLNPKIKGTSDANTTVNLYNTANCTGSVIGSGTSVEFATTGIPVNVLANSTTQIYATARSASNLVSTCSTTYVTYVEDSTPPIAPTAWAMSSPSAGSTSSDATPAISGNAAEANAIVKIYPSNTCTTGQLLGSGTVAAGAFTIGAFTLSSDGAKNFYYTIEDTFGNTTACADTTLAYTLDTTAPTVTNVTASTANGTYKTGDSVSISVTFSESVTVTGTPQLTLETGTTDRTVNYVSGSPGTVLTFTYTVQAGDTSSDLDYVSTSSLALNGGTIRDVAANNANLTLASPGAANSLSANKAIVIDTTAPTVTSVSASTANGTYKAGDTVDVTVTFSESVTVTGTPQITLETGTTDRTVNYSSGSPGSTLTFTYTVQAGDTSSDLDYVATTSLALNGGTIKDSVGNDATLTLASPGAANSLGNNKAIVIDTTAPTVTSVSSTKANGTYTIGEAIDITVTFSEAVTVTGTPQITLETGATDRAVNYTSGSGSTTLTFTYAVQAGDTSSDLDYVGTTSLALNGGTIKDGVGNDATLTLASPGAANSLGANKAIVIDTAAPTVTSVSASTADGSYKAGDTVNVTVTFSKAVTVNTTSGTPYITLETGNTDRNASYTSGSTTTTLTFAYTVQAGDTSSDLDYVGTTSLALNGGTIKDSIGNDATLTLASPGAANSLGANTAIVIDTTAPTVTSVSASSANGTYTLGQTVDVTVTFSEAVTVNTTGGTPYITLETGTTDRNVSYSSGSPGTTLTFTYTVQAGDTSSDLDYTATNALALNSGTIKDAVGNNATLTLATPGAANSLGNNKAIVIDTTAPDAPTSLVLHTPATSPGNNAQPTITVSGGGVANGLTVGLYESNTCNAAATYKGSGTSSGTSINIQITSAYASDGSNDGTHTFYADVTDAVGNRSACSTANVAYVLDTVKPAIAITSPANNSYINIANNSTTFAVNGTCTDASPSGGVNTNTVVVWIDGSAVTTTGGVCNGTTFSSTINTTGLAAGAHTFLVKFTDNAGNAQTSSSITVTKDVTAPTVSITTPASNGTWSNASNYTSYTVSGACSEDTRTVSVSATDGTHTVNATPTCSSSAWTTNLNLTTMNEGSANITITANHTDAASNPATQASRTLGKDTVAPTVSAPSIADTVTGYTDATNTLDVTVTISPSDTTSGLADQSITESANCGTTDWEASYSGSKSITIASATLGVKSFTYKVKDTAGNTSACSDVGTIIYEQISVRPRYIHRTALSSNSAWGNNKNSDPDSDDCSGDTETDGGTRLACIHAGSMKRITVPASIMPGCNVTYTISDTLGIYDWLCSFDGTNVIFDSKFKLGKGLGDVITLDNGNYIFNNNEVIINYNATNYKSYARQWWEDSITPIPVPTSTADPNPDLSDTRTVYVITDSGRYHGLNLSNQQFITLIALPGVVVSSDGNSNDCTANPDCLINLNGAKNIYLEGSFNGISTAATDAVTTGSVIEGDRAEELYFNNLRILGSNTSSIYLSRSNGIIMENSKISYTNAGDHTRGIALDLIAVQYSIFENIHISNAFQGIAIMNSSNENLFTNLIISAIADAPITIGDGDQANNYFSGISTFNHSKNIFTGNGDNTYNNNSFIMHSILTYSTSASARFNVPNKQIQSTVSQIAVNNTGISNETNESSVKFTGNLVMSGTADASSSIFNRDGVTPNAQPTLGVSNGTLIDNKDFSADLLGKITSSDDSNSQENASGYSDYGVETFRFKDFFNFDNWWRTWNLYTNRTWPDASYRIPCKSGDRCQIMDWSLSTGASKIYNHSDDPNGSANPAFPTNGGACPNVVEGNDYLSTYSGDKFLKNAIEIPSYGGNNNGICESNEKCLYMPHIGAYQGHGTLQSCTFTNGDVRDVLMYGWSSIGN